MNNSNYKRHFEVSSLPYPIVVFESDDWGACEYVPCADVLDEYCSILAHYNKTAYGPHGCLERKFELEALMNVLKSHRGGDGLPPVFTAFTAVGNPDFDAIRASDFKVYHDISLKDGVPAPWTHEGILDMMRQGEREGIWYPEYHAMLHHKSPRLWLERLRSNTTEGELERKLFDLNCYATETHLPEFNGYDFKEQFQMISTGFQRFNEIFGRFPTTAITSDAFPETELIWSMLGARNVSLKNCCVNSGDIVVYTNKPWNNQDANAVVGDIDESKNVTYLTRNVFCEVANPLEEVLGVIDRVHQVRKEPAVISSHRINYCSFKEGFAATRLEKLDALLTKLDQQGTVYLTSAELGDIFRLGWSARKIGDKFLVRKCFDNAVMPAWGKELPVGNHYVPAEMLTDCGTNWRKA